MQNLAEIMEPCPLTVIKPRTVITRWTPNRKACNKWGRVTSDFLGMAGQTRLRKDILEEKRRGGTEYRWKQSCKPWCLNNTVNVVGRKFKLLLHGHIIIC